MTAEIAILNKTAVALAADSAITVSVGDNQEKVFDTEDKLFELSRADAIGVMINNGMHFVETPLPVLIKRYRSTCPRFLTVREAANHFLTYLQEFGAASPVAVADRSIKNGVSPVLKLLQERAEKKLRVRLSEPDAFAQLQALNGFEELKDRVYSEQIAAMMRLIETLPETSLIGDEQDGMNLDMVLSEEVDQHFSSASDEVRLAALNAAKLVLTRRVLLSPHTGVIIAGFGSEDLFPTLVSYEVFGVVNGQLRIFQSNLEDVARDGPTARVIPFAQKEMVDRFLYGLDEDIRSRLDDFCRAAIPRIRELALERLDMNDDDRTAIATDIMEAEEAFLDSLRTEAFDAIREQSRSEIEDMVEFMPKSEMARMAEALVNLTSIKRRVSRGMETVGGPIDCAVISQGDGFVWVKRKHYFPAELNNRFFDRMREQRSKPEEA